MPLLACINGLGELLDENEKIFEKVCPQAGISAKAARNPAAPKINRRIFMIFHPRSGLYKNGALATARQPGRHLPDGSLAAFVHQPKSMAIESG